jgi:choline kinase
MGCHLMSSDNRLLVLSAGRGIGLDGFHKLNLVSPSTKETIITRYLRQISKDVTVVVGYRAPEIIAHYPDLRFVYNYRWFETGSAFSAALGLRKAPVIVVPSDLFLDEHAAKKVRSSTGNVIFTANTENRLKNAVNVCSQSSKIVEMYSGPMRRGEDAEYKGIVRIEDDNLLCDLRATCEANSSLAFSDCLNMHKEMFQTMDVDGEIAEINTVEEYIDFFNKDLCGFNA